MSLLKSISHYFNIIIVLSPLPISLMECKCLSCADENFQQSLVKLSVIDCHLAYVVYVTCKNGLKIFMPLKKKKRKKKKKMKKNHKRSDVKMVFERAYVSIRILI